ncbi:MULTISPECIES: carboxymuconolactone decarboxylase family protein [unclassified Corynebacterium]|uniref:carboxymuconolactone decarboxylase family protein n=1 Tax=unclassified Corynebacterium TaxID=2624378 RepID=UPI0029C9BA99|nr:MULTISPECIES: carboxymuconolactone decarboxylase family protein [unclassified Corynebacterium]WPF67342.1 carboxymuconolactone decarboxylase family protein [Corynebacterium sp. 22KM0430]WPF69835.1 carboxymuconolactone decarboxylase family protein [Corynebacterium sp. 21KM1197]
MGKNIYLDKSHPEIYRELNGAARVARKYYEESKLGRDIIELINVRVSQINGCPTCLSIHVPAAKKAGVPEQKINILPSWRNEGNGYFSDRERAALSLAESITLPNGFSGVDSVEKSLAKAREFWSDEQISSLEWAIIFINTYNRISISSGHPPVDK